MIRPPIVEAVGENFVVIEPPAGMLKLINERVEQLKKLESRFIMLDYSSIFILACLHTQQSVPSTIGNATLVHKSVAVSLAIGLGYEGYNTLRSVFADATAEQFISIINEFQFNYSRDVVDSVFDKIDELCFITKKKVDDEKKD